MKPNPTICQIWPISTSLRYKVDYVLFLLKTFTMLLYNSGIKASLIRWHQRPSLSLPTLIYSTAISQQMPFKHIPSAGLEFLHFLERAPCPAVSEVLMHFFCLAWMPYTWLILQDLSGPLVRHSWFAIYPPETCSCSILSQNTSVSKHNSHQHCHHEKCG